MPEHSWESHEWDQWTFDSDDDGMSEAERCAFEWIELMLTEYYGGAMTAQTFCVLCHFASGGGLVGKASDYALPPGRSSGKYKDHLDERLNFKQQRRHMYHFAAPGRTRYSDQRSEITFASRH